MYNDSPRNERKQDKLISQFSRHQVEETKIIRRKNSENQMVTLITKNMKQSDKETWVQSNRKNTTPLSDEEEKKSNSWHINTPNFNNIS